MKKKIIIGAVVASILIAIILISSSSNIKAVCKNDEGEVVTYYFDFDEDRPLIRGDVNGVEFETSGLYLWAAEENQTNKEYVEQFAERLEDGKYNSCKVK